ncbi:type I-B CRISPR-associated protein Cas7/Cst2/DevR [Synechococcus elongatus]|uniref:type I-B CRISPR-associated protein Cas7/Cst2/DevR n=1 Tax=Synechococcus elongatus TaxID=32046 RepID=UPI000F7DCB31|nr:type I-B CRISPR-associated protein Cas7/Cst2/DevR [Synechococcus elongatus]
MTQHLFATVVTGTAVAANNRGEGDGSTLSTLQKITFGNEQFTTVSAEAIRWGLREYLQNLDPTQVNRIFDAETKGGIYEYKDETFSADQYVDDDLFGFMNAKKGSKDEDATVKRRGAVEVTRAISLDPFLGDVSFGSRGGQKDRTSIYGNEMHLTAYQYSVALTPASLKQPSRAALLLDALAAVRHVGGNHARFLYDFTPESIALRVTVDPAPWILNCFERQQGQAIDCARLVALVTASDVDAKEIILGGAIASTASAEQLKQLGAEVHLGVKQAIAAVKARLTA